jgi:hypothetical protein
MKPRVLIIEDDPSIRLGRKRAVNPMVPNLF